MGGGLKFIVSKGVCGWGDRLQCLLQAVGYARKSGRCLVLDWRDQDWTHDQEEPTEKWFSFKGIKSMPLKSFLDLYCLGPEEFRVFPEVWKPVIDSPDYPGWIYKKEFYGAVNHGHVQTIMRGLPDYEDEVVVCPGVGSRSYAYSDCSLIELSPWVRSKIEAAADELGISGGSYDAVHLRGGSKSWAGGRVPLKSLDERIKGKWPDMESYLSYVFERHRERTKGREATDTLVLTDSRSLGEAWIDRFQFGRLVPTLNEHFDESGTHKMRTKRLASLGISKESLNFEALRDFCILLNARVATGDGVSVFSKMGERCKGAGVRLVAFRTGIHI
jgi:hypothetical protein